MPPGETLDERGFEGNPHLKRPYDIVEITDETPNIDVGAARRWRGFEPQESLREQCAGRVGLAPLVLHQPGAGLDKTLAKGPEISIRLPPKLLERLVGFKVAAGVEQFDSAIKGVVHVGMIDGI